MSTFSISGDGGSGDHQYQFVNQDITTDSDLSDCGDDKDDDDGSEGGTSYRVMAQRVSYSVLGSQAETQYDTVPAPASDTREIYDNCTITSQPSDELLVLAPRLPRQAHHKATTRLPKDGSSRRPGRVLPKLPSIPTHGAKDGVYYDEAEDGVYYDKAKDGVYDDIAKDGVYDDIAKDGTYDDIAKDGTYDNEPQRQGPCDPVYTVASPQTCVDTTAKTLSRSDCAYEEMSKPPTQDEHTYLVAGQTSATSGAPPLTSATGRPSITNHIKDTIPPLDVDTCPHSYISIEDFDRQGAQEGSPGDTTPTGSSTLAIKPLITSSVEYAQFGSPHASQSSDNENAQRDADNLVSIENIRTFAQAPGSPKRGYEAISKSRSRSRLKTTTRASASVSSLAGTTNKGGVQGGLGTRPVYGRDALRTRGRRDMCVSIMIFLLLLTIGGCVIGVLFGVNVFSKDDKVASSSRGDKQGTGSQATSSTSSFDGGSSSPLATATAMQSDAWVPCSNTCGMGTKTSPGGISTACIDYSTCTCNTTCGEGKRQTGENTFLDCNDYSTCTCNTTCGEGKRQTGENTFLDCNDYSTCKWERGAYGSCGLPCVEGLLTQTADYECTQDGHCPGEKPAAQNKSCTSRQCREFLLEGSDVLHEDLGRVQGFTMHGFGDSGQDEGSLTSSGGHGNEVKWSSDDAFSIFYIRYSVKKNSIILHMGSNKDYGTEEAFRDAAVTDMYINGTAFDSNMASITKGLKFPYLTGYSFTWANTYGELSGSHQVVLARNISETG